MPLIGSVEVQCYLKALTLFLGSGATSTLGGDIEMPQISSVHHDLVGLSLMEASCLLQCYLRGVHHGLQCSKRTYLRRCSVRTESQE